MRLGAAVCKLLFVGKLLDCIEDAVSQVARAGDVPIGKCQF